MGQADEIATRVRAAADEFGRLRTVLDSGEPWPLADDFGPGPEASWGPPEILAHVAEMLSFWLAQAEGVMAGAGVLVPFGRTADDPDRLGAIEADRRLSIDTLIGRIDAAASTYEERLGGLSDAKLGARGMHPRLGEMTVAAIFERFVTSHAEDHVRQLRESVEGRG